MNIVKLGAGVVVALVLASFCFSTNEGDATNVSAPSTARKPTLRCEPVTASLIGEIAAGLTVQGGGSLRNVYAVRSPDHDKVWVVAADIQGPSLNGSDEIAVWATNIAPSTPPAEQSGFVFSVDAMARNFSQWPEMKDFISTTSEAVRKAESCAKA